MSYFSMCIRSSVSGPSIQIQETGNLGIYSTGAETTVGRQRLSNEPLGNAPLTLQNIVTGSVVLVTKLDDTEIIRSAASGGNLVLQLPHFGSNQTVKIKVRKATEAPFYQSFETQAVVSVSGASIFINQIRDDV